jgi:rhomboid-like protein
MNILSSFPSPSSFQIGIRALSRQSERLFRASATQQLLASSRGFHSGKCLNYGIGIASSPSRKLRVTPSPCQLLPRTTIRTVFKFRAIIHYTNLPTSYDDATGLPFRKEDLNQREVNEIFGRHITAKDANTLLRIIHGRRVAGSLDDPDLQHSTAQFQAADKIKALEYLRRNIPVDEIINAGLRAEDELRMLEEQEQERGSEEAEQQFEETSPQDPPSESPVEENPTAPIGKLPTNPRSDSPYGESLFDRIRARNQAKQEAEEKRLEEERIECEREEALGNIGTLQTEQAKPKEMRPWVQKHYLEATSDLQAPPEMKAWERLLPMYAMSILVLAGCVVFAIYYVPPRQSKRIWPDIPPAAATVIGLILVNMAVFAAWKFPPMWSMMNRYLILVPATPRPFQLIGAMFSHQTWSHMTFNMVALWFFGVRLHDEIGRSNFLALYFASGTLGFLASMTKLVLFRGLEYTTLGASGAIYGIIVAYFWKHRFDEFKVFGYPPEPLSGPQGLAFLGIIIGLHIFAMFSRNPAARTLDVTSHVGGMIAGGIAIELIQRRIDDKARIRAEKLKSMGMLDKVMERKELPVSTRS